MQYNTPMFEYKILSVEQLLHRLNSQPERLPLVFTNGCFDILHRGHVTYLSQAKALGKLLVVALNTDASVRRQGKGSDRPINTLKDRLAVIASLGDVDYVTYFDQDTPLDLIVTLKPDILVKGGDWAIDQIVGSTEVIQSGGKVYSIPFLFNNSTTKVIEKIRHHA